MTIGTRLTTWLKSKQIGTDEFGNRYFISKDLNAEGKPKRSVIYKGKAEPTKIPPMWHAWLHYMVDEIPLETKSYQWQKPYMPNLTGTINAYKPDGASKGGHRPKVTGDYEAWKPE